jgi:type II secretory pathway pseudopilin PulG
MLRSRNANLRGTTRRASSRGRVGVTLLELLIVVGLLVAIMAIAMPFTMRSLENRELEATEENIASELIKARVKAQESGRPVEVVVLDSPSRVVIRYFREDDTGARFTDDARMLSADTTKGDREMVDPVRDSWWEESELHPSVSVTTLPTVDGSDLSAITDGRGDSKSSTETGHASGGSVRLAVYLPDGTTLFAASLLLMHQNGLRSRVSVDPWTGQPAITRRADEPKTSDDHTVRAPGDDELESDESADDDLRDFEPDSPAPPAHDGATKR